VRLMPAAMKGIAGDDGRHHVEEYLCISANR
jgi:hypothetical protein